MTKAKSPIDRTEANAAIDRCIELLKALKVQLRAKALDGQTLDDLMGAAKRSLEPTAFSFNQLRQEQLDEFLVNYRRRCEEP